jgi:hypothetical protein
VQKILKTIASHRDHRRHLVPKYLELDFVRLVLNPETTEFNCLEFNNYSRSHDEVYYKHLLENCPKITKMRKDGSSFGGSKVIKEIPVLELASAWSNLRYCSLRGYYCSDETLRLIKENIPRIEYVKKLEKI